MMILQVYLIKFTELQISISNHLNDMKFDN